MTTIPEMEQKEIATHLLPYFDSFAHRFGKNARVKIEEAKIDTDAKGVETVYIPISQQRGFFGALVWGKTKNVAAIVMQQEKRCVLEKILFEGLTLSEAEHPTKDFRYTREDFSRVDQHNTIYLKIISRDGKESEFKKASVLTEGLCKVALDEYIDPQAVADKINRERPVYVANKMRKKLKL